MRELARYVLEYRNADSLTKRNRTVQTVENWLALKGYRGNTDFALSSGRQASLNTSTAVASIGDLQTWILLEEISGGFFETTLNVAHEERVVQVAVTIAAGHGSNRIAPLFVDARCPSVLGTIIDEGGWYLGPTPVTRKPLAVTGSAGADDLIGALASDDRTMPIIVISGQRGLMLHPDLPILMARDLTGLALVTVAEDDASWRLTSRLGKALSCFGGAIRLYWPGFQPSDNMLRHPLWTAERLLNRAMTVDNAVQRICNTLRRRLMAVSIAALALPPMINRIKSTEVSERAESSRKDMSDQADYRALAESYAEENTALRSQILVLDEQTTTLRQQLYRLQTATVWGDSDDELQPESGIPPSTVQEALERARRLFAGLLTFGDDVDGGVADLVAHAGPPEKVLAYLEVLAELARSRRAGPLGRGMVQWLSAQNVEASTESETITRSRAEMDRRTWNDGRGRRRFDLHLKPNESTHPDQCVRIYFDWDEPTQQIVVGWVGRHP